MARTRFRGSGSVRATAELRPLGLHRRGSRTAEYGSAGGLNGLRLFSSAATRRTNWNISVVRGIQDLKVRTLHLIVVRAIVV